jgi:hypothetical protein
VNDPRFLPPSQSADRRRVDAENLGDRRLRLALFQSRDREPQALGWFYFRDEALVAREARVLLKNRPGAWR